jgi:hypothetical protein
MDLLGVVSERVDLVLYLVPRTMIYLVGLLLEMGRRVRELEN